MNCPHCPDAVLAMVDRQGVEIDCCPNCRGVWLDRGELDTLLERAAAPAQPLRHSHARQPEFVDSAFRTGSPRIPRRRKSWLDAIFD